jgi:hypothetical protein
MNDGTYAHLPNIPMKMNHIEGIDANFEIEDILEVTNESLLDFCRDDLTFSKEEYFDTIEWPKKEEYRKILDMYKDNKVVLVKVIKKEDKYLLIIPSQDDVLTTESHPPPSRQYTRVIQEAMDFKGMDYKQGDLVLEWDMKMGQPSTHKDSKKFWLGLFKVRGKSVDNSYYLSTMQGRMHPPPISGNILKPHCGEET